MTTEASTLTHGVQLTVQRADGGTFRHREVAVPMRLTPDQARHAARELVAAAGEVDAAHLLDDGAGI